ncbi:unnamed protein product [Rhizophagus irregularis]|nr:unnamed protein product [Rhizophagus irregularis]
MIDEKTEQDLTEIDQLPCATDNNALKKSFKEKYDKMEDDLKWKLSCMRRFVEDVIYENVSDFTSEQLVCWLNLSYLTETSHLNHGIITGQ